MKKEISKLSGTNRMDSKFNEMSLDMSKLSRKVENYNNYYEHIETMIQEEAKLRQNVEKKTLLMNESFNADSYDIVVSLNPELTEVIYEEKGLCAVRYPRGNEDKTAAHTPVGTDYLLQGNSGETLIIAYGRLYCEALKAQKKLKEKGISCDILKLTKIYPVDRNIVEKIKNYSFIVFFEETMSSGSISSEFGEMLAESDYTGVYRHVTVNEFVKQASVDASLEKLGLSSSKMAELIYRRYSENGKA